ncbi:MAG: hypothetical protein WCI09_03810 [Planctomycetota bacterium]
MTRTPCCLRAAVAAAWDRVHVAPQHSRMSSHRNIVSLSNADGGGVKGPNKWVLRGISWLLPVVFKAAVA